jgi:DNA-binding protein HU-beta
MKLFLALFFQLFHAAIGHQNLNEGNDMTKPMTKTQLIAALAEDTGSDRKTAAAILDSLSNIVTREVVAGGAVTIPGIGKIACRARPERQVRNPATGETIFKAADRAAKITIAKALKDAVAP